MRSNFFEMKKNNTIQTFLHLVFLILAFLAFREFFLINIEPYVADQNIWMSRRFIAFLIISVLTALSVIVLLARRIRTDDRLIHNPLMKAGLPVMIAVCFILILIPGLMRWMIPLPEKFSLGYWMTFFLIYCVSLLGTWLLETDHQDDWKNLIRISALIMLAGAAHAIIYKLMSVTSYPFTLYWSEGNRFFDYSTLYGSFRYTMAENQNLAPFITWGMQLPWAIPFLLPDISIGFFRLWYQLMWIIPSLILGYAATAKPKNTNNQIIPVIIFAFWTFLFLDQGPIYTPLVLSAILTIVAVRSKLPLGIILVIIASYYARHSRWTWTYAPGLWAGCIALLYEFEPDFSKEGMKKLVKPIGLALSGYFGGQILRYLIRMITVSSNRIRLVINPVSRATRQPLLWQRLFPNPTYPPGILLGLAWAILPMVIILVVLVIQKRWRLNWLQKLAMLGIGGAFFGVGLVASIKIGGGSNLHNLDMFLILMVMIASVAFNHLLDAIKNQPRNFWMMALICLTLIAPTTYALQGGSRLVLPEPDVTENVLRTVQQNVSRYSKDGDILFIDHRQLLAFGLVQNVPLVNDYEKKVLMDEAMADDPEYFAKFYQDLKDHKFSLIVNEPSRIIFRGSEFSFGEENDAYVKWVTKPIMCTYEPIYTSPDTSVELLVPRQEPPADNLNCDLILAQANPS